jgi:hypothetical protein
VTFLLVRIWVWVFLGDVSSKTHKRRFTKNKKVHVENFLLFTKKYTKKSSTKPEAEFVAPKKRDKTKKGEEKLTSKFLSIF